MIGGHHSAALEWRSTAVFIGNSPRNHGAIFGGAGVTMEGVGLAWWKFSIKTTRSEGSALHAPPKRRLLRSIGLVSPSATAWMEEYREMGQAL